MDGSVDVGGRTAFTADMFARAVIAAVRAFGDDPLKIGSSDSPHAPRGLASAAVGISEATGRPLRDATRILGLNHNSVKVSKLRAKPRFIAAADAARRAASYTQWRPENRESVAAKATPPRPAPQVRIVAPPPPPKPTGPIELELGPVERRIVALLAEGPANTQGMATILDVKETAISAGLRILQHSGKVQADPVPPEGLRRQLWRLPS